MRLDQVLKLVDQLSPEEKAVLLKLKMQVLLAEVQQDFDNVAPGEAVPAEKVLERLRIRAAKLRGQSE